MFESHPLKSRDLSTEIGCMFICTGGGFVGEKTIELLNIDKQQLASTGNETAYFPEPSPDSY